jgi:mRNA interferase MazF
VTYKPYDVVIMPFPFADRATSVVRPAVILTHFDSFGQHSGVALVAMITSAKQTAWPFEFPITDIASAGLSQPCVIRFKLNSIDYSLMEKKIGVLANTDHQAVRSALGKLFGDIGLSA